MINLYRTFISQLNNNFANVAEKHQLEFDPKNYEKND